VLCLAVTTLAAYPLSLKSFGGRKAVSLYISVPMFFSGGLIPLYLLIINLKMFNTFWAMVVPGLMSAGNFIIMRNYFSYSVPTELEDAAIIDGANDFVVFFRIIVPLSMPALATVALLTFIWAWLDFMGPLVYLNDESMYTLALGLAAFLGRHGADWSGLMAAGTVVIAPIIVIFFFAQRTFIRGIALTGMKG